MLGCLSVRIQAIETVHSKHISHGASVCWHILLLSKTHRHRQRHTDIDRHKNRQTDIQIQTHRQTDTGTDKDKDKDTLVSTASVCSPTSLEESHIPSNLQIVSGSC